MKRREGSNRHLAQVCTRNAKIVTAKGLHRRACTLLYFVPEHSDFDCNKPGFFPSSKAIFSRLNSGSRMVIARAHRVAA
jgi:hypothetical protein